MHELSYEQIVARLEELRPKMDDAISEIFQLQCAAARLEGDCLPDDVMLAEYIVVCGWQSFNDRGQRQGDVRLILREGSMPLYVARGLTQSAIQYIENNIRSGCQHDAEDDDDG